MYLVQIVFMYVICVVCKLLPDQRGWIFENTDSIGRQSSKILQLVGVTEVASNDTN